MKPEESERIGLSVPKTYSKAFDSWFWTCCQCKERFQIKLSICPPEEYSIKGERACKSCVKKYSISRIPKHYNELQQLRKKAQELGVNHKPICSDDFLRFDTECESYVDRAVRFGNAVFLEKKELEKAIARARTKIKEG